MIRPWVKLIARYTDGVQLSVVFMMNPLDGTKGNGWHLVSSYSGKEINNNAVATLVNAHIEALPEAVEIRIAKILPINLNREIAVFYKKGRFSIDYSRYPENDVINTDLNGTKTKNVSNTLSF